MSVLYVSPIGQDSNEGSVNFPIKTIAHALRQVGRGGVVQLAAGTYQVDQTGEQFPLQIPDGVTLASSDSRTAIIKGGGLLNTMNVAVVLGDRAQIRGITITNPQGSGILVLEGAALIIGNRLVSCQQSGVVVTSTAHPFVSKNEFIDNGSVGLSISGGAKGEIRQNRFERTGDGITLSDKAAPLIIDNQLVGNRCAFSIANGARPVLRKNHATRSEESALWIQDRAQPDIGQPQDLGDNWFEGKTYDVRNDTPLPLSTAGNQINPVRVKGSVAYLPSEIPDEVAVPAVLLGNVEPQPLPPDPLPDTSADLLDGLSLDSRFNDLVGHWSAPFVEALAEKNLVKGFLNGTFQPDNQVTRAEFAALVTAAFPQVAKTQPVLRFSDVSADFWGARAIRQAQAQGFLSGFPDGSFRPNAPLTKVQAIVALVNGLSLGAGRSEALLAYRDRAQVPSYATNAVATATNHEMIAGYPNPSHLKPLSPISRAETTALVHQSMVAVGTTEAITSPFIFAKNTLPSFTDLPSQHWARGYIDPMVAAGWLSGFRDGTFRPDAPITRAQFATVLVNVFDPPAKREAIQFRDVAEDFWGAAAIQRAYRAKFISGFPDLTFDPNYSLTKLQSLLALVSGLNLQAVSAPDARSLDVYRDRAAIPDYATQAIASATQLGLVFNYPTLLELRPSRVATRAEICAMVYQSLTVAGKVPAVASPYQVLLGQRP